MKLDLSVQRHRLRLVLGLAVCINGASMWIWYFEGSYVSVAWHLALGLFALIFAVQP